MEGQLPLFTFEPRIEVVHPTPLSLKKKLWKIVMGCDPRGYSFGDFTNDSGYKEGHLWDEPHNENALTVIIYKEEEVVGFCTLSLSYWKRAENDPAGIDVWVMPKYRDQRLGSILTRRTNEESIRLTGRLPAGHDKNRTHNWDARFRRTKVQDEEYKKRVFGNGYGWEFKALQTVLLEEVADHHYDDSVLIVRALERIKWIGVVK